MKSIAKKILVLSLALIIVFSLAACGTTPKKEDESSSEEESSEKSSESSMKPVDEGKTRIAMEKESPDPKTANVKGKKVGLAINALDEYQTEWREALLEAAEVYGLEIITTNAEGKADKQLADVESLITSKVDLLLIRCVDNQAIVPSFEAADAAGIPTIDSAFGANYDNTFSINSSQYFLTTLLGDYLNSWLAEDASRELKTGYLWGSQGSTNSQLRFEGWKDTVEAVNKDRFELLTENVTNWSVVDAMSIVEDWLQAYPTMNTIVGASDELAIASTNVLLAADRRDDFIVVGVDGSINAQKLIREGVLDASVYTSKKADARITIDYIVRILSGEDYNGKYLELENEITDLLTKDTIDEVIGRLG